MPNYVWRNDAAFFSMVFLHIVNRMYHKFRRRSDPARIRCTQTRDIKNAARAIHINPASADRVTLK